LAVALGDAHEEKENRRKVLATTWVLAPLQRMRAIPTKP